METNAGMDYAYTYPNAPAGVAPEHGVRQVTGGIEYNGTVTVRAKRGTGCTTLPVMKLYINGTFRQQWTVTNKSSYSNYSVATSLTTDAQVDVVFTNAYSGCTLQVDYVTIPTATGTRTVQAESGGTIFDRGAENGAPGANAFDGVNVINGAELMTENGSLRFVVGLNALAAGYDANGNMTLRLKDGARYFLTYDAENRLTSVSGTVSASFVYNGDGQRVSATIDAIITTYIGGYFEWQGGAGTSYYFAGAQRIAMRTSTDLKYLLGDHLGSTSVTAYASGAFDTETRYYPWGGVRWASGTTPTDYRFTDQQEIATIGLYFYNSRFYDAALGRFVSPDIIIPNPGDPVSFDRFGYVRNNPLKYVDPSGYKYYCGSQGSQYDPEECDFEPLNPMSIDKSALNPGGLEAFNTLSYLASLDSEWWGKGLTAQEAIAMVLLLEASVGLERVQSGYWAMNSDVIEAITRQYNEHCGSGPWSAGCFNGFWAYYEPLINGSRLGEVQANNLYNFTDSRTNTNYGNVYMRTAGLVASKTSIGGEYPDNPDHWVTLSLSKNPLTYAEVLLRVEAGSYPFFSFMEGSDKIFIVLSANLATELCGDTNCTDAP